MRAGRSSNSGKGAKAFVRVRAGGPELCNGVREQKLSDQPSMVQLGQTLRVP